MTPYLRKNTAITIPLGPYIDDTDGKTSETALNVHRGTVRLSKLGGAFAQKNDPSTGTHMENGYYSVALDSTDLNTIGRLKVHSLITGALPVWQDYEVLPENIYDAWVGGSGYVPVNTYQFGGTVQTARDIGAYVDAPITSRMPTGTVFNLQPSDYVALVNGGASGTWHYSLAGSFPTNTAGRKLKNTAAQVVYDGTVVSSTVNTVTFDAGASSVDKAYDPAGVFIQAGKGAGQCRLILQYNGASRTAIVDRDWSDAPDVTSEYIIFADIGRDSTNEGLAQGGGANTITLNINASSDDDVYNGQLVHLRSGQGQDQIGLVIDYDGTSKVATVSENWAVVPNNTTGYDIYPAHEHDPIDVWDVQTSLLTAVGSIGKLLVDTAATVATNLDAAISSLPVVGDIWTYVTRTLTSGGGGGGASAADIWTYADRTLTAYQVGNPYTQLTKDDIMLYVGDTLNVTVNNITIPPNVTEITLLVLPVREKNPTKATIYLSKVAGLIKLNGEGSSGTWGAITNTTTSATFVLQHAASTQLDNGEYSYKMRMVDGSGTWRTFGVGKFQVYQ